MKQPEKSNREQSSLCRRSTAEMENVPARKQGAESIGGFTLSEMMVGLAIFVMIVAGLLTVFTMSMLSWKEGSRDLSLQGSGRLIIEKIVRGPGGRFGLREAAEEDVTIAEDGKGITFRVDKNNPPTFSKVDDTEVRIYLGENRVMYDPSTGEEGDEVPLVGFGRVADLQFEPDGKAIGIVLWMTETSQTTHASSVKLGTKVFLRKSENPDTET